MQAIVLGQDRCDAAILATSDHLRLSLTLDTQNEKFEVASPHIFQQFLQLVFFTLSATDPKSSTIRINKQSPTLFFGS